MRKIVIVVAKILKSNVLGRWIYPVVSKLWHCYSDPKRRRTIQKYGTTCLQELSEIAEKEGIQVVPIYGTLLGLVREGGFMKHDDDIDVAVFPGKSAKDVASIMICKYGYKFRHGFAFHGVCTEFTLEHKSGLTIDFFFLQDSGECLLSSVYFWKKTEQYTDTRQNNLKWVKHPYVTGFRNFNLNGIDVKIPENSEDWLYYEFGKGWRVPDPSYTDAAGQPGKVLVDGYGYATTYDEIMSETIPH